MGKLFCILGKSSSGKDSIFRALKKDAALHLGSVVPYTTRPRRKGETEGGEYHFISENRLRKLRETGKVIECRRYETVRGVWYYCTVDDGSIDLMAGDYLMIATPEAYRNLKNYFGAAYAVSLYIEVDDGQRLERALRREQKQPHPDYEELCRRFLADSRDFSPEKLCECGITKKYFNNSLSSCIAAIREDILQIQNL